MPGEAPVIRLKLACSGSDDFHRRFAGRFRGDFFVPAAATIPVDGLVRVKVQFADGEVRVSGEASARPAEQNGRRGLMLRFARLFEGGSEFAYLVPSPEPDEGDAVDEFSEESATQLSTLPEEMAEKLRADPEPVRRQAAVVRRSERPTPAVPIDASASQIPADDDLYDEGPNEFEEATRASELPLEIAETLRGRSASTPPPAAEEGKAEAAPEPEPALEPEPAPESDPDPDPDPDPDLDFDAAFAGPSPAPTPASEPAPTPALDAAAPAAESLRPRTGFLVFAGVALLVAVAGAAYVLLYY